MILYDLAIELYGLAVRMVSPFNPKAEAWTKGRRDIFARMREAISPDDRVVWFHAASLGEFEQGRPLMEAFRKRYPEHKILLTFFSPSGYEVRKDYEGADYIFYLPSDTLGRVRRFLDIARPEAAVFVKYEFWKNYLTQLHRRGIPTYVVSAVFDSSQLFFRRFGGPYRKLLRLFDRLFVQNERSRELLASIGITDVTVCGDTRFDRVIQIVREAGLPDRRIVDFAGAGGLFIAGSTWPPDDDIIVSLIERYPQMRFLVAPHELGEAKISSLCERITATGASVVRFTGNDAPETLASARVMVLDTIGQLSLAYRYGSVAYIGGGFGVGIHNTLEAATFGMPIAFGPNYKRFSEAVGLIEAGAARSVFNAGEAAVWLGEMLDTPSLLEQRARAAESFVMSGEGAVDKILDYGLLRS
jgi:3-deoxy-D-manno-octulosonic-acid transferase